MVNDRVPNRDLDPIRLYDEAEARQLPASAGYDPPAWLLVAVRLLFRGVDQEAG